MLGVGGKVIQFDGQTNSILEAKEGFRQFLRVGKRNETVDEDEQIDLSCMDATQDLPNVRFGFGFAECSATF